MTDKKKKYLEAIKHIQMAKAILTDIGKADQKDCAAGRYAYELGMVLSQDNDEAGLIPFFKTMK